MAIRTVRLDDEAEQALTEIRRATGLNTSDALKRGLEVLRRETRERRGDTPHDLYEQLDLGPGGYAVAAAADSKRAVRRVIRRKHGR
jgi:autonomous glycyl radical cofactor GrcA